MKRIRLAALLFALLLTVAACGSGTQLPASAEKPEAGTLTKYTGQFMDVFDTVVTLVGCAESQQEFQEKLSLVHADMLERHRLYDVYNDYEGISNIKTVNDNAGIAPVPVDRRIIDLLVFCRDMYPVTHSRTNVMMGSVLRLWHQSRADSVADPDHAYLPDVSELKTAAPYTVFDYLEIDEEKGTVFITDPHASLDVGAVAKGYSTEQAAKLLPQGYLISAGGNVRAVGNNTSTGKLWNVGVADPKGDGSTSLMIVCVSDMSVVTSGDYQRYYTVDGVRYCHIIDPDTLYPADRWASVTVICPDSGKADMLSTALFLLSLEDGAALALEQEAEALWIDHEGKMYQTEGFSAYVAK